MFVYTVKRRPGTQSIFKPIPGIAHECVTSSDVPKNLTNTRVGKTKEPVDRNSRNGSDCVCRVSTPLSTLYGLLGSIP
jgi:hypothetical protein